MRRDTDEKPTPPTQPPFGWGDQRDEHRHVRPPPAVVDPERALRLKHADGWLRRRRRLVECLALDAPRPPTPGRPLNPSRDEQNEQLREGERSAGDAANEHVRLRIALTVVGLELHTGDSIATRTGVRTMGKMLRADDQTMQRHLDQWQLRPDGQPTHGDHSIVQPVLTSEGARAVLKIVCPNAESEHEHLVLRRWGGNGAVRRRVPIPTTAPFCWRGSDERP